MLKKLHILLIAIILTIPYFQPIKAEDLLRISSLRVSTNNTSVIIIWNTNLPASGMFEFGLTNGFGNWIEDKVINVYHETTLGGLLPEKKYYFRLRATTADGQSVLSDIYDFTTVKKNDTEAPILSKMSVSFTTGNTATFIWETDEAADSCITIGTTMAEVKDWRCDGYKVLIHDLTVYNLTPNTLYYYTVSSADQTGNRQTSVIKQTMTSYDNDTNAPGLIIYDISPFNQRLANDIFSADLIFKTNRPVSGVVRIGEQTNYYSKEFKTTVPRTTETTINLTDLKENQRYYYKLYLTDVLGKTLETVEYTFTTLSKNILKNGTKIITNDYDASNPNQDFDQDGLTNAQEKKYGTDPVKADTDGDGIMDGQEILKGTNPLDGITVVNKPLNTAFAYNKPRLKTLTEEQRLANELKAKLTAVFKGKIPKNKQHWYVLTNAYIYGNYPVAAIAQAIKFGGKTVHPEIPFAAWQNTNDYKNYINR